MARPRKTRRIRLDAATACQLKCPSCPTASGEVGKNLGTGFLRFDDFKQIVDRNPWLSRIELSNWGEIFLNPHLVRIMKYAYENNVDLQAHNGTNLNTVKDETLEALAKYRFHHMSVSLDGASQETYSIYRVNGDFDTVISNVERINHYKAKYRSKYPTLRWQFVAFGHNEHEIDKARQMASDLDMDFVLKLSWGDLYTEAFSPTQNEQQIRDQSKKGVASRDEFEKEQGENYKSKTCWQLWRDPVVNFDGRVLGCCINHWGDFGRVEDGDLTAGLNNEKLEYARDVLTGRAPARPDLPCLSCEIFESMQKNDHWIDEDRIKYKRDPSRLTIRLRNKLLPRLLGRAAAADEDAS